ncbi:MAG: hypothetical protein AB7H88_11740 [Vicinamibacterales bacterium]
MTNGHAIRGRSLAEVLKLHCEVLEELRRRGITRSANNPVADYTEVLVAAALELDLEAPSSSGYDAIDKRGRKYQIKGRRIAAGHHQLSSVRSGGWNRGPLTILWR